MLILCDIDQTIADNRHRQGYLPNWDNFFAHMADDKPIEPMRKLLRGLLLGYVEIIYMTGRPERYRQMTYSWLVRNEFPQGRLICPRKDGDHRPDEVVKREMLKNENLKPDIIIDDRDYIWKDLGLDATILKPIGVQHGHELQTNATSAA